MTNAMNPRFLKDARYYVLTEQILSGHGDEFHAKRKAPPSPALCSENAQTPQTFRVGPADFLPDTTVEVKISYFSAWSLSG
jgi:hypothetical protein